MEINGHLVKAYYRQSLHLTQREEKLGERDGR
jgi:hypothetical protein